MIRTNAWRSALLVAALATFPIGCTGDDGAGPDPDALPSIDPDMPPVTQGSWYRPPLDVTWQWQIDGTIDPTYDVQLYDIDLFDAPDAVFASLRARGVRVLCYFSAGTYEQGRPDATSIPASARGKSLEDFPSERWLDIRDVRVLAVMHQRLDLAARRGCDGVEPDNMDAFVNDSGFALTAADQLAFNRNLANEAHLRGLTVALKNDGDQVPQLVEYFDLELNEECHQYDECAQLAGCPTPAAARAWARASPKRH